MRHHLWKAVLVAGTALFLTAATAFPLFAKTSNHLKSGQIDVIYPVEVANGHTLRPGNYKVELDNKTSSPKILFYQEGKLVAQAPAKLVDESKKNDQTEVFYKAAGNGHVIAQIDLQGWKQNVVLTPSGTMGTGS
jgi:hypothetical protein